ncbi:MAG: N-acetylmuramic acid 6-phosphate etherase, partial [Zavarzinella sp.]|nr:N-acetylmuramic acid 6-phosphate etherase [Zavarzinella sp.]
FNSPPGQVVGVIAGGYQALTTAVEGAEDHPEFGENDLRQLGLSAKDVLVGIATSGRTPYVIGALGCARSVGAFAIGLACVPDSDLAPHADLMIAPLVGPEVVTGSTRLKAGTATKLVLNMLTTGAMVRLGKTYGNLMVDLRATNVKLKARTNRIVRLILGTGRDDADALLARCDGELKTALVVGRTGLAPDEARRRLAAAGGRVGEVLTNHRVAVPSLPQHVLGVDGGGTHTVALLGLVENGGVRSLGRGEAGPSNMKAVGAPAAFAAIDRAVSAAFAQAGLSRAPVAAACLGLAGAGRAEDQATVTAWATRTGLAAEVETVADTALPIALLPDGWGVAVVAGTGSCVWARSADGRTIRAGGWGPLLGDEGSAYALALAGLRTVVRAADGRGPRSDLADRLLGRMKLGEASQLVSAVYGGMWDRARLATLAVDVIRAADERGAGAEDIVSNQVTGLAECIQAGVTELGLPRVGVPIALAGGLLVQSPTYRDRLVSSLARMGIQPGHVLMVPEPAEGALRLAADRLARANRV